MVSKKIRDNLELFAIVISIISSFIFIGHYLNFFAVGSISPTIYNVPQLPSFSIFLIGVATLVVAYLYFTRKR